VAALAAGAACTEATTSRRAPTVIEGTRRLAHAGT
jgi:hypothetical protein